MFDIIIIGAGPAGLTAALYAGRANKKVLVLEAKAYGGQIINSLNIENYPGILSISGFDYATNLYNQVIDLDVSIKMERVVSIEEGFKVYTSQSVYEAKSIIIATGVQNRKLDLDHEDEWIGKGISYCATCDGAFFKNKVVAVQGGGNTALEDALYLSNIAKKVYLIHRRDHFRGEEKYIREVMNCDSIEVLYNSTITAILGDDHVQGIEVHSKDQSIEIPVDGLFIAIGHVPQNECFQNVITLDDEGYVLSSDGVHTSHSKIYVAGDTRVKELRQLTTAVSDGAMAATMAIKEMED